MKCRDAEDADAANVIMPMLADRVPGVGVEPTATLLVTGAGGGS